MRAALVALTFVTACGAASGQDSTPLPPPSPPTALLAAWKDFPANTNPRPIIRFGDVYEHVSLVKPLGGRVLVDAQGNVGSVYPETGDC